MAALRQDITHLERRRLTARLLSHVETQARELRERLSADLKTLPDTTQLRELELSAGDLEQEASDAFEELRRYAAQVRDVRRRQDR